METKSFAFTATTNWAFTGSLLGGTATSSVSASVTCYGAGGHGSITGNGGSGGAYAQSLTDIVLKSGSILNIVVGRTTAGDGGASWFAIDGGEPLVRAAGGKIDGTVTDQEVWTTGSLKTALGGLGGANFTGYSAYNGGGGGGCGGYNGNGQDGQSGYFSGATFAARGGVWNNTSATECGGSGSFYQAGAGHNWIVPAGAGARPGCGGGGGYDYPAGVDSSGAAGAGLVTVILTDY